MKRTIHPRTSRRRLRSLAASLLPCLAFTSVLSGALPCVVGLAVPGLDRTVVGAEPTAVKFERVTLERVFRSEGVAVGDYNRDGKMDIAAGYVWYEAPDWKMHSVLPEPPVYNPRNYSNAFVAASDDLNGDGWTDLMIVDFPGEPTWYFENPGKNEGPWKKVALTPVSNNESPQYVDLTGDGRREWVMGVNPDRQNPDSETRYIAFLTPGDTAESPWKINGISAPNAAGAKKYDHGLGTGDINGDGRSDVVVTAGWWEAPEDRTQGNWTFHQAPFGEPSGHMHVFDFDGDGDNDVLSSSAHAFGIWWHEQLAPGKWQTHEIDKSFSQTHSSCLVDIDQDGLPDLVTGKRWWAHAESDPGWEMPAVMVWLRLTRENGRPVWTQHRFDDDSGVGTQFEVADINADGMPDVACSNKKGVHIFLQSRK